MTEARLKQILAQAALAREARGEHCDVPLESMVAILERQGSEAERHQALLRILAHPACRAEFELLRAVVEASRAQRARKWWVGWGWAAAALAILLAGVWWRFDHPPPQPLRGDAPEVRLAGPAGAVVRTGALAWHPVESAWRYELALVDGEGNARYETSTADTLIALPDSVRLETGSTYRWWVRALLPDGSQRRSATAEFTILP